MLGWWLWVSWFWVLSIWTTEVKVLWVLGWVKSLLYFCMYKINHMPRPGNVAFTSSIKREDRDRFKINCFKNGDDMSVVLNRFMNSYSDASENARKKNKINSNE